MSKKALVLLNMGGARTKDELEVFLRNMLNDKNIIAIKNDTIRSMLASILVAIRSNKTWENYKKVENKVSLHELTEQLIRKLNKMLPEYFITTAMRYTSPFAQTAIARIKKENIKEVVLLPLYPHYSNTTVKSSIDDFIEKAEDAFSIRVIDPFYKSFLLNKVICDEIVRVQGKYQDFHLIFSAVGLPQNMIDKGDPYQTQIEEHFELLKEQLSHYATELQSINLAYQSKSGLKKWLRPNLIEMLRHFKNKKVIIYPLSFVIDNMQTVFELDIEYREIAKELEIKDYRLCSCPNDSDIFCEALKEISSL